MTTERLTEITNEAERRLKILLQDETMAEITVSGSKIRLDMALSLAGGDFYDKGFKTFVNDREFKSPEYDNMLTELLEAYYYKPMEDQHNANHV
jgi:hypothetical protein